MEVTPKIRPSLVCLGDCFVGRVTDLPVSLACGQLSGPPPGPIWMPCLLHMRSSWIPGGCWCPGAGARRRGSDLCEPQMGVGRNRSPRTRGVDVAEAGGRAAATGGPAPQISQQASDSAAWGQLSLSSQETRLRPAAQTRTLCHLPPHCPGGEDPRGAPWGPLPALLLHTGATSDVRGDWVCPLCAPAGPSPHSSSLQGRASLPSPRRPHLLTEPVAVTSHGKGTLKCKDLEMGR